MSVTSDDMTDAGDGGEVGREPCLTARGVWKVFGTKPDRALELAAGGASRTEIQEATGNTIGVRDVSFDVLPGETFVIMGLSGSGKSTLLRCVAQLIESTRGQITLEGRELTTMTDAELRDVRRRDLSMVFQHFGLFPHRKVIDNVAYGLEVQGLKRADRHAKATEMLDLVGLGGWGDHYPQQLSGGMQQRVGLARALAVEPTVLFFDEPFSALDPLIRRDMQDELLRLQAEMNRTIVFVTHDFDEAIKLGDRIAIMKDGEFDQIGTAEELVGNPATEYVREFTKDVSRAKVLTAASVMAPVPADGRSRPAVADGATVRSDASVESLLPVLLASHHDVAVVDEMGSLLGHVDRSAVRAVLDTMQDVEPVSDEGTDIGLTVVDRAPEAP
ncbi:quaternary amine ABC transporter ATP-binding protein [Ilumatobacter sp.]|uniref:quaternary amine ABC transporter ATP-binding protein n=1 Tax=Ilumatobacter sp. TaxID=1967498 RepID=UPI003C3D9CEA